MLASHAAKARFEQLYNGVQTHCFLIEKSEGGVGIAKPAGVQNPSNLKDFYNHIAKYLPTPPHLRPYEIATAAGATQTSPAFGTDDETTIAAPRQPSAKTPHGRHKAVGTPRNTNAHHIVEYRNPRDGSAGGNTSLQRMAQRLAPS